MIPHKFSDRTEFLHGFARRHNMEFRESDSFNMVRYLRTFKLGKKGNSRKIYNISILKESLGEFQFRLFDYRYMINTGKSTSSKDQTVFLCMSRQIGVPAFNLKVENLLHKIGQVFGYQDIDFEMFPVFSQKFLLQGEDEDLIRHLFSEDIVHFFCDDFKLQCEANNFFFILYKEGHLVPSADLSTFWKKGEQLFQLFKNQTVDLTLSDDPIETENLISDHDNKIPE